MAAQVWASGRGQEGEGAAAARAADIVRPFPRAHARSRKFACACERKHRMHTRASARTHTCAHPYMRTHVTKQARRHEHARTRQCARRYRAPSPRRAAARSDEYMPPDKCVRDCKVPSRTPNWMPPSAEPCHAAAAAAAPAAAVRPKLKASGRQGEKAAPIGMGWLSAAGVLGSTHTGAGGPRQALSHKAEAHFALRPRQSPQPLPSRTRTHTRTHARAHTHAHGSKGALGGRRTEV